MIDTTMSAAERKQTQMQVDSLNNTLKAENGRAAKTELGKDDFLQILITQLTHQDPTSPVEDTQFIAQMAQFSTLEQMSNMSRDFAKIAEMLGANEAVQAVGKRVDIMNADGITNGVAEAVTRGAEPQILVNGKFYDWADVSTVYGN